MCNCNKLPRYVADIELWTNPFQFSGKLFNHLYFETPDSEYLEPRVEFQIFMYRCTQCGQYWYVEGTPEENSSAEFALKVAQLTKLPSNDEVKAAKEYLCILAHGGFDSGKCRVAGCQNYKLIGRELCHLHIPFPS